MLPESERAVRHGRAADAVKAVAAGDDVTPKLTLDAAVPVADHGGVGVDALRTHVLDLEQQRRPRFEACGDQVLHDLLLAVDRDAPAAGELIEGDPVAFAGEAQLDAMVDEALALETLADADLDQEVDRPLLEHTCAHPSLDVVARTVLEDYRLDALEMQQVSEHEAGRPRADDSDLRAGQLHCAHGPSRLTSSPPG